MSVFLMFMFNALNIRLTYGHWVLACEYLHMSLFGHMGQMRAGDWSEEKVASTDGDRLEKNWRVLECIRDPRFQWYCMVHITSRTDRNSDAASDI